MSDSTRGDNFDASDALEYFKKVFKSEKNPGEKYPSRPCDEDLYDLSKAHMGMTLIFNQINFDENESVDNLEKREGTQKDVNDLTTVLKKFGFSVKNYVDQTTKEIKRIIEDGEFLK